MNGLSMDVVNSAIVKARGVIDSKPQGEMDQLYTTLDISPSELSVYAQKNTLAFAQGLIDQELSMFVYNRLMNWHSATLAERVVLTQVFLRLLAGR